LNGAKSALHNPLPLLFSINRGIKITGVLKSIVKVTKSRHENIFRVMS